MTTEITGIRNNKEITLTVEIKDCHGQPKWVRKQDGKPLFGSTGYISKFNGVVNIETYRGKMVITDVHGIDASLITEENRDLWVDGRPPEAL